jgi:cell wall-associated NlpC family hydrolase
VDFQASDLTRAVDYCKRLAPLEAGGYIDRNGGFVPLQNLHPVPTEHFHFPHIPTDAQAIVHSHPGGPFAPSELDQRQQIAFDIPWVIIAFDSERTEVFTFGDSAPVPPLVGRGFRHYVTDCYAGMRDLYRVKLGVELPHFPRVWQWWERGGAMLADGFTQAGFSIVSDPMPGDVLLCSLWSKTPNHCAVWLGDGLIYHHLSSTKESAPDRLSTVEAAGRWFPYISTVVRHADDRVARASWSDIRRQLQT